MPSLSFVSISGTLLTGFSTSLSDVSSQNVVMTVSLADYPSIKTSVAFKVEVICTLTNIIISPTSFTIVVGIDT